MSRKSSVDGRTIRAQGFEQRCTPSLDSGAWRWPNGTKREHTMPADGYLDYIELPGTDIPATKKFYGSVFGWSFTDYGPEYVAFDSAGRQGGCNAERKVVATGGPLIVLYAADLDG